MIPAPPSTVHGLAMSVNSERVRSPKRSMKGWAAAFVSVEPAYGGSNIAGNNR